jgi:hypothetical protein
MPCIRYNTRDHRRFLPHFPPGTMRCEFSPELVPPLLHAMMRTFPKAESEPLCGSPTSPLSPLTPTAFLIPKPPGEVSRVGRGGYTLKDVLEEQHGWKDGHYDKIRVLAARSRASCYTYAFFQERVRLMADKYLDTSLTYSTQAKSKVDLICEMVRHIYLATWNMQFYSLRTGIRGVSHPPQI